MDKKTFKNELKELLIRAEISPNAKYLTAKQIEVVYGIPSKTILNRSNLPKNHRRFIPSVRLQSGGRKKYFERKVMDRMIGAARCSHE